MKPLPRLSITKTEQELSYRKQIARQLRTQFVECISVTLKSTLMVIRGHWKRNHWTDHTWLTIKRVIGRWILSWPWNVGQRSLKIIEISAIWKLGCGFLFAFYSNYGHICSRLWDIQCQRMGVTLKTRLGIIQGHWKWCRSIDHMRCDFLLVCHCNYSSILYHFRVIWHWIISWPWNRG